MQRPGKLTQALGMDLSDNGTALGRARLSVYRGLPPKETRSRCPDAWACRPDTSWSCATTSRTTRSCRGTHGSANREALQGAEEEGHVKLSEIYDICVRKGIAADARDRSEIDRVLNDRRHTYDKLEEVDKEFFDFESLVNPYADTRICAGDPETDVRGMLVGVDMEVGEVLLADRLREKGEPIDLVFAHHPEGPGYANLHEVMYMQADLWAAQGVSIAAADALIAPRAQEVQPPDHAGQPLSRGRRRPAARAGVDVVPHAGGQLGQRVRPVVPRRREARPRWRRRSRRCARSPSTPTRPAKATDPRWSAARRARGPGRIVVDMTGGTEGPTDALDRLSQSGVGTLVGMHYSEEHKKRAEELKLNLDGRRAHLERRARHEPRPRRDREAASGSPSVCTSGMVRDQALPERGECSASAGGPPGAEAVTRRSGRRQATAWTCWFRCRHRCFHRTNRRRSCCHSTNRRSLAAIRLRRAGRAGVGAVTTSKPSRGSWRRGVSSRGCRTCSAS